MPATVPPAAPTVVTNPRGGSSGGTSAGAVAIAVGIGALAGIGGTLLVQWGRANRVPDPPDEDTLDEDTVDEDTPES